MKTYGSLLLAAVLLAGCSATTSATPAGTVTETVTETVTVTAGAKPAPAKPSKADDVLSDGDLSASDLRVKDSFGSLSGTVRVTNNGPDSLQFVSVTITLFKGGKTVGTLTGVVDDIGVQKTVTMQLFSTDKFTKYDRVEFQVD